jgi:hypothetical protein
MSNLRRGKLRRAFAAVLSAVLVGVVGISAIPLETAQAAGVVVERHQSYGAAAVPPRGRVGGSRAD